MEKALAIQIEVNNREGKAKSYGNLGPLFISLGNYDGARQYLKEALAIIIESCDRDGEATFYGNLATVFQSLSKYGKAREYLERRLAIQIEISDRGGEATTYGNLGTLLISLVEYEKARVYLEKALAVKKINQQQKRRGDNLRQPRNSIPITWQIWKGPSYLEKALAIQIEIGNRDGEATSYGKIGTLFRSLGKYDKAWEYLEKALAIKNRNWWQKWGSNNLREPRNSVHLAWQIWQGPRIPGESTRYQYRNWREKWRGNNLREPNTLHIIWLIFVVSVWSDGNYNKAREYLKKALPIYRRIGCREGSRFLETLDLCLCPSVNIQRLTIF